MNGKLFCFGASTIPQSQKISNFGKIKAKLFGTLNKKQSINNSFGINAIAR